MIGIVDYGFGNLGSIKNMLDRLGYDNMIVTNPEEIENAEKIILPGVGAFDMGMKALNERGWIPVLNRKVLEQNSPTLGICLGMQLMTQSSEEGVAEGLGWVNAATRKFTFPAGSKLKVPHMGWNIVRTSANSILHQQLTDLEEIRFYFVHSYYVDPVNINDVIFSCSYGNDFCAAFQHKNIYGVQFHPEKSHQFGLKLLKNFASL